MRDVPPCVGKGRSIYRLQNRSTTDLDVTRVMTGTYIRPRLMACLAICSVYNDKGGQVRIEKLFHLGVDNNCVIGPCLPMHHEFVTFGY